ADEVHVGTAVLATQADALAGAALGEAEVVGGKRAGRGGILRAEVAALKLGQADLRGRFGNAPKLVPFRQGLEVSQAYLSFRSHAQECLIRDRINIVVVLEGD